MPVNRASHRLSSAQVELDRKTVVLKSHETTYLTAKPIQSAPGADTTVKRPVVEVINLEGLSVPTKGLVQLLFSDVGGV